MSDLISRQAAIVALRDMAVPLSQDPGCEDIWERDRTLDCAIDVIRELPATQSEQRWIPCSKRLPKLGHRVLFKMCNNDVYIGILLKLNDGLKITLEPTGIGYVYSFENVIAWMPLPE